MQSCFYLVNRVIQSSMSTVNFSDILVATAGLLFTIIIVFSVGCLVWYFRKRYTIHYTISYSKYRVKFDSLQRFANRFGRTFLWTDINSRDCKSVYNKLKCLSSYHNFSQLLNSMNCCIVNHY